MMPLLSLISRRRFRFRLHWCSASTSGRKPFRDESSRSLSTSPAHFSARSSSVPRARRGAKETALALQPNSNDWVILKPRYRLAPRDVERIAAAGSRKALVCGVDTDACVLGVTFSLFDAGIDCEVDPALCWSSTGLHEPALKIIQEQFGTGKH